MVLDAGEPRILIEVRDAVDLVALSEPYGVESGIDRSLQGVNFSPFRDSFDLGRVDDVVWRPGVVKHDGPVSILRWLVEAVDLLRLGVRSVSLLLDLGVKGLRRSVSEDDL